MSMEGYDIAVTGLPNIEAHSLGINRVVDFSLKRTCLSSSILMS